MQGRVALALVAGLALIAVALALGLFAVADGIRDRGGGDTISVTGSAKRSISSDYLIWNASISVQRETTGAAAAQLERWLERTLAALRASGIQDDELTVAAISTASVRGRAGKLTGFRLTRSLQVRSARLDAVVAAIEDSSRLLAAGVPLSAGQPQYVYTKLAELRPALSADATKDALRRAEAIVEITGDELGGVRNVYSSPFQVTAPGSTEVEDYGIYDTSTREKEVTAVVNVTFAVK
ncbi:MAG TPA: SIMPL domain-containing protein [Gaiellaceae bacterium]